MTRIFKIIVFLLAVGFIVALTMVQNAIQSTAPANTATPVPSATLQPTPRENEPTWTPSSTPSPSSTVTSAPSNTPTLTLTRTPTCLKIGIVGYAPDGDQVIDSVIWVDPLTFETVYPFSGEPCKRSSIHEMKLKDYQAWVESRGKAGQAPELWNGIDVRRKLPRASGTPPTRIPAMATSTLTPTSAQ